MASISIGNLNSGGKDLLLDSESYLDSLSDELSVSVKGGGEVSTPVASPFASPYYFYRHRPGLRF
jgi:hypothetical protein